MVIRVKLANIRIANFIKFMHFGFADAGNFCDGSEIDQLYKVCCILGAPDWNAFPEATNISRLISISYSEVKLSDGITFQMSSASTSPSL